MQRTDAFFVVFAVSSSLSINTMAPLGPHRHINSTIILNISTNTSFQFDKGMNNMNNRAFTQVSSLMRTLVLHFNEEAPRWGEGGQWCHTHSFIPPSPLLSSPHLSISLSHPLKRKGKICKGKPLSLNILHACPGHFRQHVNPQSPMQSASTCSPAIHFPCSSSWAKIFKK